MQYIAGLKRVSTELPGSGGSSTGPTAGAHFSTSKSGDSGPQPSGVRRVWAHFFQRQPPVSGATAPSQNNRQSWIIPSPKCAASHFPQSYGSAGLCGEFAKFAQKTAGKSDGVSAGQEGQFRSLPSGPQQAVLPVSQESRVAGGRPSYVKAPIRPPTKVRIEKMRDRAAGVVWRADVVPEPFPWGNELSMQNTLQPIGADTRLKKLQQRHNGPDPMFVEPAYKSRPRVDRRSLHGAAPVQSFAVPKNE